MRHHKKLRKHWYRIHVTECVICSAGDTIRERVYGKKPKDARKRYTYEQFGCSGHFV
jgi:hypothetical protein